MVVTVRRREQSTSGPRIAVLGAGALGLTAAYRLAQGGYQVAVYEREGVPGGLAAGFEIEPGMWIERFYHHAFGTDHTLIRLLHELGLESRLTWHRPITSTFVDGRAHQLDSALSLMLFSPLSPVDRLRVAACLALLKALPSAQPFESKRAAQSIRRVMGARAYEKLWQPLLESKFGDAAEEIALPWFWARIHDRTSQLGYLSGGFHGLYQTLQDRIEALGGRVVLGRPVTGLRPSDRSWAVSSGMRGEEMSEKYDRVISTLPLQVTAKLTPDLDADWARKHSWSRSLSAHCLVLALDRPLTEVYWLNIADRRIPFMALVEHTNLRSPEEYGGRHLVYLGNYWPPDDARMMASDEEILKTFLPGLRTINPSFQRSWIGMMWRFRAPHAQPIVTIDYRRAIPGFGTPLNGLYAANMFQVYPHDRGQNYSIRLGESVASMLATAEIGS